MTSSNLPHVGEGTICNHFPNTVLQQVTDQLGLWALSLEMLAI